MGLSLNQNAIKQRIHRLPELVDDVARTVTKKHARRMVQHFRSGLENREFDVKPLKMRTIKRKRAQGMSKPYNPLRGIGMDGTRTLVSSIRTWETANGYKVGFPDSAHHSGKVTVKALMAIHENGCLIRRGKRIVRLPARPVFALAYTKTLKGISDADPSSQLQKAAYELLDTGSPAEIRAMKRQWNG
jgi:hypothetical protein